MFISHARVLYDTLLRCQLSRHGNRYLILAKRHLTTAIGKMKRKADNSLTAPKAKRVREPLPEYCDVAPQRDEHGSVVWPASVGALESARSFLRDWYGWKNISYHHVCADSIDPSATSNSKTLIVPDKDADGLDAGVIVHRTLTAMGLPPSLIDVHLLSKGSNIHDEMEREAMLAKEPKYIIIVDHGSRKGPPVVDSAETKALIIDHHLSDEFPQNATVQYFLTLGSHAFRLMGDRSFLLAIIHQ